MDQDIIQKVKQANKDRDLATIAKVLRNASSREEKIAIMTALCIIDPVTLPEISESEDYQKDEQFARKLADLFTELRLEDRDILDYLNTTSQQMLAMECVDEKIGSGDKRAQLILYFCSNTDPLNDKFCQNRGTLRCTQCGLVAYCSKSCQKEHWKVHKGVCRDSLFRSDRYLWKPRWVREKREPNYMNKDNQGKPKLKVRLWGNTPAFDLIGFKCNEGKDNSNWQKPLNLAFVASGDFRSLVETLASVPDDYQQPITIVLNDKNPVIVARNLFMLSLLLAKGEAALDLVIAIWYSAAMTETQQCTIGMFLQTLMASGRHLEKGLSAIELNELEAALELLLLMVKRSLRVDFVTAMNARKKVMLTDIDYLDRIVLGLEDYHRESYVGFLSMGLLQPYRDTEYILKNFQNQYLIEPDLKWLIDDTCDPKQGWSMVKVMEFGDQKKFPKNDLYGRLFFYIRDRLSKLLSTMRRLPVKIRMFQKDPKTLAKELQLQPAKFDRIDLTHSSDEGEHGIDKMLNVWGSLLNKKNPNSAIVTLSRKWTDFLPEESIQISSISPDLLSRMVSLIGLDRADMVDMTDPVNKFLVQDSVVKFGDHSEEFEKYMKKIEEKKPKYLNRRMEHTIVPHQVMFPIEGKPNTTIESLSESDQYWIFNCTADPTDRYSEWTLGEN